MRRQIRSVTILAAAAATAVTLGWAPAPCSGVAQPDWYFSHVFEHFTR
jgi:hypothetical protein